MPRKERVGTVVSDKMNKTRVIAIVEREKNHRYDKVQTKTVRFKAHDAENVSHTGDTVRIVESRPFSKETFWLLTEVIKHVEEV